MKNITIKLPKDINLILDTFHNNNYEAYIIGGCVRDSILGLKPHDWDITTNATPDQVMELFKDIAYKIIPTGIKYGTVTILLSKGSYEITTYRKDGNYSDGRRPDEIEYSTSLKEDIERRDFTINGLAYNKEEGLIDYFEGYNDLQLRILKTILKPQDRFKEDALRLLRAIRFALRFNLKIEEETLNTLNSYLKKNYLKNVSKERIHDEIIKIYNYLNKDNYEQIKHLDLSTYIFPFEKEEICFIGNYLTKLAFLFILNHKDECKNILQDLKYSNYEIKQITNIISLYKFYINHLHYEFNYLIRLLLSQYGENTLLLTCPIIYKYLIENNKIDILYDGYYNHIKSYINKNKKYCLTIKQLNINGNDIKFYFNLEGAKIKKALQSALNYVLANPEKNNKQDLYNFLKGDIV